MIPFFAAILVCYLATLVAVVTVLWFNVIVHGESVPTAVALTVFSPIVTPIVVIIFVIEIHNEFEALAGLESMTSVNDSDVYHILVEEMDV